MQSFIIFDEIKKSVMQKEIKTATEKIKELNELGNTLTLHQKLHRAKLAIGKVTKNATNPHFKKAYADINALLDAVEPILLENGLLLLQPIQGNNVCTQIIDIDSGAMIESCMELPSNLTPQQLGSAVTYYRRYTLQSSLSLQAIDDDANTAEQAVKQPVKETLSAERFKGALDKIAAGEYTVEQLKSKFNLTKEQEAQL
jgi:hypothetical protein